MDVRERKLREMISRLETEISDLTRQIEGKQSEAQRFRDALDVWLSIDGDAPPAHAPRVDGDAPLFRQRFRGRKFMDCVRAILEENGPQSTAFIFQALADGGFQSEAADFRGVVTNMLNEAAKNGLLLKHGERKNAIWSLPRHG